MGALQIVLVSFRRHHPLRVLLILLHAVLFFVPSQRDQPVLFIYHKKVELGVTKKRRDFLPVEVVDEVGHGTKVVSDRGCLDFFLIHLGVDVQLFNPVQDFVVADGVDVLHFCLFSDGSDVVALFPGLCLIFVSASSTLQVVFVLVECDFCVRAKN